MSKSQVELFLERLSTDPALRQKITEFEEKASASALRLQEARESAARANAFTIIAIAKEAGYDIPTDFFRSTTAPAYPTDQEMEGARCTFTCCLVKTSCLKTCSWTFM
jgi:hypothetical protein